MTKGPEDGTRAASDAELDELFRRWRRAGDQLARDELIERFTPLARRLAARYRNSHDSFDDLVQVALVGLIGAVDRFDPDRGAPFVSFAVPTILGELKRYFRTTGWSVHVPRRAQELAQLVARAGNELTERDGRSPNIEELAQFLELPMEDVLTGLEAGAAHFAASLDAPAASRSDDADPAPLVELIGDHDGALALTETRVTLSTALREVPLRERQALYLRVTQQLKQNEIAERLGCSQMHVSRLLRRAADRLNEQNARD